MNIYDMSYKNHRTMSGKKNNSGFSVDHFYATGENPSSMYGSVKSTYTTPKTSSGTQYSVSAKRDGYLSSQSYSDTTIRATVHQDISKYDKVSAHTSYSTERGTSFGFSYEKKF